MSEHTYVYASLGRTMRVFALDPASGELTPVQSLEMPAIIQYGWPNRSRNLLYVATSDAGPMVKEKRPNHFAQAYRIGPNGALTAHGPAVKLAHRPLHLTLDAAETHLLFAYNDPPHVSVHRIGADGRIGEPVAQPALDFGVTVHQVRATPSGRVVIVPACGHHPTGEAAGSLGIFAYDDGRLTAIDRIHADPARAAPWRGKRYGAHGFAARHVDFHPTRPWMYLCVERQGELRLYDYDDQGVAAVPRAIASTLAGTQPGRSIQLASAIHVHPNGRFVYVTNRARDTEEAGGKQVFVGGVNDIAVFAIDPTTGVPTLIQHADTFGCFPRTFGIGAGGRMLVAGNHEPLWVRAGDKLERWLPSLVVYRIGDDGRLTLVYKRDFPEPSDPADICFWTGVINN